MVALGENTPKKPKKPVNTQVDHWRMRPIKKPDCENKNRLS